jgi:hypothetical protein
VFDTDQVNIIRRALEQLNDWLPSNAGAVVRTRAQVIIVVNFDQPSWTWR